MSRQPNTRTNVGHSLHAQPTRLAKQDEIARVLAVADEIFDRYVGGENYQEISVSMKLGLPAWRVRSILMNNEETSEKFVDASIYRSHHLVDQALEYGKQAAAIGDAAGLRTAIDVNMKVAAKINAAYNDKATVEHTGKGGGAIEIVADLSLTAEQAYERLIKGG